MSGERIPLGRFAVTREPYPGLPLGAQVIILRVVEYYYGGPRRRVIRDALLEVEYCGRRACVHRRGLRLLQKAVTV